MRANSFAATVKERRNKSSEFEPCNRENVLENVGFPLSYIRVFLRRSEEGLYNKQLQM